MFCQLEAEPDVLAASPLSPVPGRLLVGVRFARVVRPETIAKELGAGKFSLGVSSQPRADLYSHYYYYYYYYYSHCYYYYYYY